MSLAKLGEIITKIRSKNAGPFWLTIDLFCGSSESYARVVKGVNSAQVAKVLGASTDDVKRFDIPDLHVIKFSLPRPSVQGAIDDRDMHGASWAVLLAEIDI